MRMPGTITLPNDRFMVLLSAGNLGGPGLDVGDHLPCNLVVFEQGDTTVIAGLDPTEGLEGWEEPAAAAARAALERVLEQVAGPVPN